MPARRRSHITQLGELQVRVLEALGDLGEGTVYDVLERFSGDAAPRYTTILTVLRGLERRALVTHRVEDRSYVFRPTKAAQGVHRQMLHDVLDRVFHGSPGDLMAALLDADAVTPEVPAEMKRMIAKKEREEEDGR